jgi:hypothetical protein
MRQHIFLMIAVSNAFGASMSALRKPTDKITSSRSRRLAELQRADRCECDLLRTIAHFCFFGAQSAMPPSQKLQLSDRTAVPFFMVRHP